MAKVKGALAQHKVEGKNPGELKREMDTRGVDDAGTQIQKRGEDNSLFSCFQNIISVLMVQIIIV